MRLYTQHSHQKDATLLKWHIRSGKLVIFGCRLSSNAVLIFKILVVVLPKIWTDGPRQNSLIYAVGPCTL